jgi:hypothetical protein
MAEPSSKQFPGDSDIRVEARAAPTEANTGGSFLSRMLSAIGLSSRPAAEMPVPASAVPSDFRITVGDKALTRVLGEQREAVTRVYQTLHAVGRDLEAFFPGVPRVFARRLEGRLLNPDGLPARRVSVEALQPEYTDRELEGGADAVVWPAPLDTTDDRGAFGLRMPVVPIPESGLRLRLRGGNGVEEVAFRRIEMESGKLGLVPLVRPLTPLSKSVISSLKEIVPKSGDDVEEHPHAFAEPSPSLALGPCSCKKKHGDEDEHAADDLPCSCNECECAYAFRSNCGVIDRFRFSILVRLIEPQVLPKQLALRDAVADAGGFTTLPAMLQGNFAVDQYAAPADLILRASLGYGSWHFVDRVPVAAPVDVTAFRSGVESNPGSVPKAASLGLGYVLCMRQTWIPAGLSLGDMLYALPLAPGEQQRVAVYERAETAAVVDSETLSMDEAQRMREASDNSTLAVFDSAAHETVNGSSKMSAKSNSLGGGVSTGAVGMIYGILMGTGISGGFGSSASSGNSAGWQSASRDFTSRATQDFHSTITREAAASRRASRTGVRMATAAEREQVTTKVITNHNHCHALTMQYWEVLRHFCVCTEIDDVQLVCLVPLELIQFLPTGHPRTLPTGSFTRNYLLARYAMLIRYHDVLAAQFGRNPEHAYGLRLLREFASNPTASVQSSAGLAQDVVTVTVKGTFLSFEDVYVSVVTRSGLRVGAVKMTGASTAVVPEQYATAAELLDVLRRRRGGDTGETRTALVVLPSSVPRNDIARFELTRTFQPFAYKLKPPPFSFSIFPDYALWLERSTVTLHPSELEQQLGGPYVWDASAVITGAGVTYVNAFAGRASAALMTTTMPLPTLRVAPLLSFSDLLRVEATFQHVIQNTVAYSKAVWMSLTPEERAILLERFTVGVPPGGVADASQEVPLLNCVSNEVLGFYGNSIVMPFEIPPRLAAEMEVTSRDVQEALLRFHRQCFVPPQSSVTLPARGMLGEAVLGGCTSCEKIDITRFWNWKDSPADEADKISASDIKGTTGLGTLSAPSVLATGGDKGQPGSIITINSGDGASSSPAASSTLLEQMMKQMPAPTAFPDLTGAAARESMQEKTLTEAIDARKDAMKNAQDTFNSLLQAYSGAKAAQEKKEKEDEKEKEDKEKEKADKVTAGVKKVNDNSASYIGVVGAAPDDAAALAKAETIVAGIFGKDKPSVAEVAPLYDKLKPDNLPSADPSAERGKKALSKALGLTS